MRHIVRILLIVSIFSLHIVSASAQTDEASFVVLPSCTPEELAAGAEHFSNTGGTIRTLRENYDFSTSPVDDEYADLIIGMEQILTAVEQEIVAPLPKCLELQLMGSNIIAAYQQILITMLLKNANAWSEEGSEDAEFFTTQATANLELASQILSAVSTASENVTPMDFPACTADEISEVASVFELFSTDISEKFVTYMSERQYAELFKYTEQITYGFVTTVFPQIPACQELASTALELRSAFANLNLTAGFAANGTWEAELSEETANTLFTLGSQYSVAYGQSWVAIANRLGVELPTATQEPAS